MFKKSIEKSTKNHSHLIVTVTLEQEILGTKYKSKFSLIDLASSTKSIYFGEKSNKQKAMKKYQSIIALKQVIKQLGENSKFIPYDMSKLTQALKDSLGGNSKSLMLACINPSNISETISTLEIANSAKNISNKVFTKSINNDLFLGQIKVK